MPCSLGGLNDGALLWICSKSFLRVVKSKSWSEFTGEITFPGISIDWKIDILTSLEQSGGVTLNESYEREGSLISSIISSAFYSSEVERARVAAVSYPSNESS